MGDGLLCCSSPSSWKLWPPIIIAFFLRIGIPPTHSTGCRPKYASLYLRWVEDVLNQPSELSPTPTQPVREQASRMWSRWWYRILAMTLLAIVCRVLPFTASLCRFFSRASYTWSSKLNTLWTILVRCWHHTSVMKEGKPGEIRVFRLRKNYHLIFTPHHYYFTTIFFSGEPPAAVHDHNQYTRWR